MILVAAGIYFMYKNGLFESVAIPTASRQVSCSLDNFGVARLETGEFSVLQDGNGAGKASVSGRVIVEERVIWSEPVRVVYVEVEKATPAFQNYFLEMAGTNNSVNLAREGKLMFKLGAIVGGRFSTTAILSDEAKAKIENALISGESLSLDIEVPVYAGSGAPDNFSFACAINAGIEKSITL